MTVPSHSSMTPIRVMQQKLYQRGNPTWDFHGYVRKHNLNMRNINAHSGLLAVCLCKRVGAHFDFDDEGVPCAIIEVYAEHLPGNEQPTIVDLVCWPLSDPSTFITAIGEADMLGISNMRNPATYFGGRPITVHKTPLDWIKDDCNGCVVLNKKWGGYWLSKVPGALLASDIEHGRQLRLATQRYGSLNIVVRRPERKVAA